MKRSWLQVFMAQFAYYAILDQNQTLRADKKNGKI